MERDGGRLQRETYLLILRFLEASPCAGAFDVLQREAAHHGLLGARYAWTGRRHSSDYAHARRSAALPGRHAAVHWRRRRREVGLGAAVERRVRRRRDGRGWRGRGQRRGERGGQRRIGAFAPAAPPVPYERDGRAGAPWAAPWGWRRPPLRLES